MHTTNAFPIRYIEQIPYIYHYIYFELLLITIVKTNRNLNKKAKRKAANPHMKSAITENSPIKIERKQSCQNLNPADGYYQYKTTSTLNILFLFGEHKQNYFNSKIQLKNP